MCVLVRSIIVFLFVLPSLLCFLTACSVSERVSYKDDEGLIPSQLLKKIKKKKTEKSWVVAHLGAPYTIDRVDAVVDAPSLNSDTKSDEMTEPLTLFEVYTYRFTRSQIRSGHVLFFLSAGGRKDDVEYFHVAFDDDVVQKSWMDKYPRTQLGMRKRLQKVVSYPAQELSANKKNRTGWRLPSLKKWFTKKTDKPVDKSMPNQPNTPIQAALSKTNKTSMKASDESKMMQKNMSDQKMEDKESKMEGEAIERKIMGPKTMENKTMKEKVMENGKVMEKMSSSKANEQQPLLNK